MKKIHGMDSRERLLLQIAVVLHNCGKFMSLEDVSECAFPYYYGDRDHRIVTF